VFERSANLRLVVRARPSTLKHAPVLIVNANIVREERGMQKPVNVLATPKKLVVWAIIRMNTAVVYLMTVLSARFGVLKYITVFVTQLY
jgi:hypothetical protein